jgi:hypothetical protein
MPYCASFLQYAARKRSDLFLTITKRNSLPVVQGEKIAMGGQPTRAVRRAQLDLFFERQAALLRSPLSRLGSKKGFLSWIAFGGANSG